MSQNVVNFDFQGVVDLFIHEISGDWSQIMSKLNLMGARGTVYTRRISEDRKQLSNDIV